MNRSRKILLISFTLIVTFVAIYLNWDNFLMGNNATLLNLVVSVAYLSAWFILSFYLGVNHENTYKKFILAYWGTNFVYFVIAALSSNVASLLLPLAVWFGGPLYGFRYLIASFTTLYLATALFGPVISASGYWIGTKILKR